MTKLNVIKSLLLCFITIAIIQFSLQAQVATIKGKVTDVSTKEPVAGATVAVKNSTKATATNSEGEFSINASDKDELTVSYVGYEKATIKVTGSFLAVKINPITTQLNDVVVTALGVKKETKRIGYAIQEVRGEDLVKARDANPISGLTGKVAGLSVGPSAELLRKPTVLLRGNEITLYVVDGIPISSDTWNISPDDIETYTVLKGLLQQPYTEAVPSSAPY